MDIKTLREKTPEALSHELHEATERLQSLVFKLSSNQIKNVREVRKLKKQIARIETIMSVSTKNV